VKGLIGLAPGHWLESLDMDKHSSLFRFLVRDEEKKFYKIDYWESVSGWATLGGAMLGTKRTLTDGKLPEIAKQVTISLKNLRA
jgi:hypothetical protein